MGTRTVEGMGVLNTEIPDDIHRAARMAAFSQGISLKEYVARALAEKLERDDDERR